MDIVVKVVQLILCLSLLVFVHELGHFMFAKLFKTRVEKFYLFFNPWFSLLKFKIGETEYGIGWVPFGGYVKIAGMIDESMDKEQMKQPPQPYEFRSKPAWQRLLIMTGGVIMNILTAFVIYVCMSWHYGESYIADKDVPDGYAYGELAQEIGFRDGDRIVSVRGKTYDNDKRRLESYFAELFHERSDKSGKRVSILVDSDAVNENPLYRLYKAKSFTDNDLILHFSILGTLSELKSATAPEIINYIDAHYANYDVKFDLGIVRLKLNEYTRLGILKAEKRGTKLYYSLLDEFDENAVDWDVIHYFSEVDCLGVIGSYLLDRQTTNDVSSIPIFFKHRQLFAALDSIYLLQALEAIHNHIILQITRKSSSDNEQQSSITTKKVIPLRILINRQNGRQYIAAYDVEKNTYLNYRLDHILEIIDGTSVPIEFFEELRAELNVRLKNTWNVNYFGDRPYQIKMILHVGKDEQFILRRLFREGHGGDVEQIGNESYLYQISIYDPSEMIPWVKSFIGRIENFQCENKQVENRFYNDVRALLKWMADIEYDDIS